MEGPLSLRKKYLRIVAGLLPTGAVGLSLLLASTAPSAARPESAADPAGSSPRVSERLAAIREAVSELGALQCEGAPPPKEEGRQLAWGNWGNFPFLPPPWGNWNNWNNWHNNWGNWRNYWRNW